MKSRTTKLTTTGLFAAMITIITAYICHIPYGANGGYIHFGDALIYLSAVFLPPPYALAAAAPFASLAGSAVQSGGSAVIFLMLAIVMDKGHVKDKTQSMVHLY